MRFDFLLSDDGADDQFKRLTRVSRWMGGGVAAARDHQKKKQAADDLCLDVAVHGRQVRRKVSDLRLR